MIARRLTLAATAFIGFAGSLPGVPLFIEPRADSPEVTDIELPSRQVQASEDVPLDVPRGWVGAIYEGPWYGYISATMVNELTGRPRPGTRVQLQPNSQLPPVATVLEGDQVEVIDGNEWWTRIKLSKPLYVYYPAQDEQEAKSDRKLAWFSLPWGKKEEEKPVRDPRPEPQKVTIVVDGVQKEVAPGQSIGYNPRGVAEELAEMQGGSGGSGAPRSPDGSGPNLDLNPNQPEEPLLVYNSPLEDQAAAPQPAPAAPAQVAPARDDSAPQTQPARQPRQQVQPAHDDFFVMPSDTLEVPAAAPTRSPRSQVMEVSAPEADDSSTTPPPASITALDAPPPSTRRGNGGSTFQPQPVKPTSSAPARPEPEDPVYLAPEPQPSQPQRVTPPPPAVTRAQPVSTPAVSEPNRSEPRRVRELQPRIFGSPAPQSGPIARNEKVRVAPPVPDPFPVNRDEPPLRTASGEIHDTFSGRLVRTSRKWYALHYPKYPFELQSESGKRIAYVDISGVLIHSTLNDYVDEPVEVYGLWDTTDEAGIVIRARNMRLMAP